MLTVAHAGTGARGLRSIMESVLMDAMFDTPGETVCTVVIDDEVRVAAGDGWLVMAAANGCC